MLEVLLRGHSSAKFKGERFSPLKFHKEKGVASFSLLFTALLGRKKGRGETARPPLSQGGAKTFSSPTNRRGRKRGAIAASLSRRRGKSRPFYAHLKR